MILRRCKCKCKHFQRKRRRIKSSSVYRVIVRCRSQLQSHSAPFYFLFYESSHFYGFISDHGSHPKVSMKKPRASPPRLVSSRALSSRLKHSMPPLSAEISSVTQGPDGSERSRSGAHATHVVVPQILRAWNGFLFC